MRQFHKMTCLICGKESKRLGRHVLLSHNLTAKQYYDKYFKSENEGICPMCGKDTPFLGLSTGYQKHCCARCGLDNEETKRNYEQSMLNKYGVKHTYESAVFREKANQTKLAKYGSSNYNNREKAKQTCLDKYGVPSAMQIEETKNKIKKTCMERYGFESSSASEIVKNKIKQTKLARYGDENYNNQEKYKSTCLEKYGTEHATQSTIVKQKKVNTNLEKYGVTCTLQSAKTRDLIKKKNQEKHGVDWYVESSDFKEKCKQSALSGPDSRDTKWRSLAENTIIDEISKIYDGPIFHNNNKIIYPKELDIVLPDLNLAIEHNGLWYHSEEARCPKDYHLKKSLLCREKGIRLIHIYEFENLDEQIKLLKDLILGIDNYPKNDFNKNNLIDHIPEPEIVYQENRLCIYGAGKLY